MKLRTVAAGVSIGLLCGAVAAAEMTVGSHLAGGRRSAAADVEEEDFDAAYRFWSASAKAGFSAAGRAAEVAAGASTKNYAGRDARDSRSRRARAKLEFASGNRQTWTTACGVSCCRGYPRGDRTNQNWESL